MLCNVLDHVMEHVHDWSIVQETVVLRKIAEPEFDWIVAYGAHGPSSRISINCSYLNCDCLLPVDEGGITNHDGRTART